MKPTLTPGAMLSRYKVTGFIGAGGMAEVFEATDTTLGRSVALKILPAELVSDPERLRRFVQEAKTASSLNHPNIVTIYEIGEAGEVRFIAMELVDGTSLAERLRKRADLRSVLGWLSEVADGVGRAHAAGIVHRDLKPDNIMITREGHAKVLDFGVAKLIEKSDPTPEETTMTPGTAEGIIVGTPSYMSPEQVRGERIDHRSDVFSMGCILYEAATGERPFGTGSHIDVMHRIVYDPPASIEKLNAVPGALRRVIRRCMEKEPQQRFQSMQDLSTTLRDLYEDFDSLGASSEGSRAALARPSAHRSRRLWIAAIAAVVVVITGVAAWRSNRSDDRSPRLTLERMSTTRLTSGSVYTSAISPDGKYVLYVFDAGRNKYELRLKQIVTGSEVTLVDSPYPINTPTFSADGSHVYYRMVGAGSESYSTLYKIPALGGSARKVVFDVDGGPTFSPDGRMAFLRGIPQRKEYVIVVANADGSSQKVLLAKQWHAQFLYSGPAWSPDGEEIAFGSFSREGGDHHRLSFVDAESGKERLHDKRWKWIQSVEWLNNGELLLSASDRTYGRQVWIVNRRSGEASRLTNGLDEYVDATATADGRTITATQRRTICRLYTGVSDDPLTPMDLMVRDLDVVESGVVFTALRNGAMNLWSWNAATGSVRQLTEDGTSRRVSASRNGKILYSSSRAGGIPHIWEIDVDGGNARQLTTGGGEIAAAIAPEGQWFGYVSTDHSLWLQKRNQKPTKIGEVSLGFDEGKSPAISPDGKRVMFSQWNEGSAAPEWRIVSSMDASVASTVPPLPDAFYPRWTPDGRIAAVRVIAGEGENIWTIPDEAGAPERLTNFASGFIYDFGWSPDGKSLYVARGHTDRDVVLITDFRAPH